MSISDRVVVMRAGRVEQVATPAEVYARPISRYVARFVGSPQAEILEGALESAEGRTVYRVGDAAFEVPPDVARSIGPSEVDLTIRPEHITLDRGGAGATVRVVQPLGPVTYVTVGWAGGELTARLPGMTDHQPGQATTVRLDPGHLLFFDRASGRAVHEGGASDG